MRSIAIFNNKGGVGKTTLTYHLACALSEQGHRTLLLDLDPQSNLTLYGLSPDDLDRLWEAEEPFIDDFDAARQGMSAEEFSSFMAVPRTSHLLLKATEDGTSEPAELPPPVLLTDNLGLIPGRLSLHMYEDRIASRWSDAFRGDPLSIRTITRVRKLCEQYAQAHGFGFVLIDTSPSLGILNKVIISTTDGFLIPCGPDIFSLYGIKNIGRALGRWRQEFETMYTLLSNDKRNSFPAQFVQFLGFTIYNARKRTGQNELDIAQAHYNHAQRIPETIFRYIEHQSRAHLPDDMAKTAFGNHALIHSHNTLPGMAQKYRLPIWRIPSDADLEADDINSIRGNRLIYEETKDKYHRFADDLLTRIQLLGAP